MTPSPHVSNEMVERVAAAILKGLIDMRIPGAGPHWKSEATHLATAALSAMPAQEWSFDMGAAPAGDELLLYYAPVPRRNTALPAMMRLGRVGDTPFRPPVAWMRVTPPTTAQE